MQATNISPTTEFNYPKTRAVSFGVQHNGPNPGQNPNNPVHSWVAWEKHWKCCDYLSARPCSGGRTQPTERHLAQDSPPSLWWHRYGFVYWSSHGLGAGFSELLSSRSLKQHLKPIQQNVPETIIAFLVKSQYQLSHTWSEKDNTLPASDMSCATNMLPGVQSKLSMQSWDFWLVPITALC